MQRTPGAQQEGFLLLIALFATTTVLAVSAVGLGRSMSELNAATRSLGTSQAFQLAEAGIDDALRELATGAFASADGWTTTSACSGTCRTKTLTLRAGLTVSSTVDDITTFEPTVTVRGASAQTLAAQSLQARLRRATVVPSVFTYVIAGTTLNLDGNARIGDLLHNKSTVYLGGPPSSTGDLMTGNANEVYAKEIQFYNPNGDPLAKLCKNCDNPAIFHQPLAFTANAPQLPDLELDLRPYYMEAVNEGHVLSADTTYTNANLTGVYYVECGVTITFAGTSTVTGTIVHEGCNGHINVGSKGTLTLNSQIGSQFAPGMAIVGAPSLGFGNGTTVNVTGFVMHHGPASVFASDGTIEGGLVGVNEAALRAAYPDLKNGAGPGSYSSLKFELTKVDVGGSAHLLFQPLSQPIPGVVGGGGGPAILSWRCVPACN